MPSLGITEFLVILVVMLIVYGIPVAAVVWIIITLNRIHSGQKIIRNRLDEIEHAIHQSRDRQ
jgi:hypothetical protein